MQPARPAFSRPPAASSSPVPRLVHDTAEHHAVDDDEMQKIVAVDCHEFLHRDRENYFRHQAAVFGDISCAVYYFS